MTSQPDSLVQIYRNLYDLLDKRERRHAFLIFLLTFMVALLEVVGVASIMPFMAVLANQDLIRTNRVLSYLYGTLNFESQWSFLIFLGLGLFFFLIGSMALKAVSFWAQVKFSNSRVHSLSYSLFTTYLGQPYSWFLRQHTSGLANKVLSEVNEVVYGALFPSTQVIANGLAIIFLLCLLLMVDPVLAVCAAAVLSTVYGLTLVLTRRRLDGLGEIRTSSNNARFRIVQEALGGIKDVKLSALENRFLERYSKPSRLMTQGNTSAKVIGEIPSFVMQGLVFGGLLIVLLYFMITKGGLEEALPILAVYAFAGYRLIPALQALYSQLSTLRYHSPLLKTLHADFQNLGRSATLSAPQSPEGDQRLRFTRQLTLSDLHYTYPGSQQPALAGINLTVPFRTKIGLVGSSGSGKTTAIDVILGLLQPDRGVLRLDDTVIGPDNLRRWQRNIGYVPQQIYLTDETITENIAFGVLPHEIDKAAVQRAAQIANLHHFIVTELREGYDTLVGERGVRLSGGQRQRIGIARALYHNPEVLILDEATSALDNLTEKAVMEAMDNLGNEKTIILIAHRLSTVRSCDCIYVLEHGCVVAEGTYEQLLEKNAHFRAMAGDV
jgi:ABC-type multidrug transport system fused ATPase/permease subunit